MSAVYVSGPGLDGLPTGCAAGDTITGTLKLVTVPEGVSRCHWRKTKMFRKEVD